MPDHPRVGGDRRRFSALLRNFEGNRADGTTLEEILDSVERKHSSLGRVWVFDRGLVSEENLALLRERGVFYFVTQAQAELVRKELLKEDRTQVAGRPQIQVKLLERDSEFYALTRSTALQREAQVQCSAIFVA